MIQWLVAKLDAPWKRILAAVALSTVIILAVSTFAESSYVQTQKVQQESARGQHCKKWGSERVDGTRRPVCQKWENT